MLFAFSLAIFLSLLATWKAKTGLCILWDNLEIKYIIKLLNEVSSPLALHKYVHELFHLGNKKQAILQASAQSKHKFIFERMRLS